MPSRAQQPGPKRLWCLPGVKPAAVDLLTGALQGNFGGFDKRIERRIHGSIVQILRIAMPGTVPIF